MVASEVLLEHVFKTSGIPTHTFVEPLEYRALLVALRTPGRGVVIEGPSGIGKTTSVTRALDELESADSVLKLSARRGSDRELIESLPDLGETGVVVIDDFHRLPDDVKVQVADHMKLLADEEVNHSKIVVLGINDAGKTLVRFASDLNNRIEVVKLEVNPIEKVEELLSKGEQALHVRLNVKDDIAKAANGSFYIAQMLAHQVCVEAGVLERCPETVVTEVSFEAVGGKVQEKLSRTFAERTARFAKGTRFRRAGRAPYLNLLHLLATSDDWSLSVSDANVRAPELSGSIAQIVEKGYLAELIRADPELSAVLHFDDAPRVLSVEDPQFLYYLRNLAWSQFSRDLGFTATQFASRYDVALSFAGSDRDVAGALCTALQESELEVFYDYNEQHRILAEDVEDYLRPIYQSEAAFVVAVLGPDYPDRIWTRFESKHFAERFREGAVIPVWFSNSRPTTFDESGRVGGFVIDRAEPIGPQVRLLSDLVCQKVAESRQAE